MKNNKKIILILTAVLAILTPINYSSSNPQDKVSNNKGPLITNNLYPLYLPFINLLPDRGKPLGAGNIRLIVATNYANTFNLDRDGMDDGFEFDMDVENLRLAVNIDVGVTDYLDLGMETAFVYQYGGFLDSIIQGFHNIFGFANAGRNLVEDNQFRLKVQNENGTWIDLNEPAGGLGDITFKAKLNIVNKTESGFFLSIQPAIKIPTGDEAKFLSSGKYDYAINLLAEQTGYNYGFYLNLGWIHLTKPDSLVIFDFTEDLFSYVVCYEWLVRGGWSLYIQADGNSSPYKSNYKRLDDQSATINLGFKYEISESIILQVSFAEEFFTFATTDVSFLTAMTFNF